MNESDIDSLGFGSELNELIAIEIMGEERPDDVHDSHLDILMHGASWYCLPEFEEGDECLWSAVPYSSEWKHMGNLIEKILDDNWWSDIGGDFFLENWQDNEWVCCNRAPGSRKERWTLVPVFYAVGKTPMLAVCRAALKAKLGIKAE